MSHVPQLILELLQVFYPHVRYVHAQTIVKAQSTLFNRATQCRHSADIFSNSNGSRVNSMNKGVCEHQVNDAIDINMETEVFAVVAREALTDTVMMVEY